MEPSFIVINPDNGIIYQLNFDAFYSGKGQCITYANTFTFDTMNKQIFDQLLSDDNEKLNSFFDDMGQYMQYILLIVIGVIAGIYIGYLLYLFASMILEGFVATVLVYIIIRLFKCCGAFNEFSNISPTLKQIWRINVLLCVPDFTFVRLMQLTSIAFYYRICARIILTLLLIIDTYQNEPPHDRQS